jgi:hypothetical protein
MSLIGTSPPSKSAAQLTEFPPQSGHADKLAPGIIGGMSLFTRCGQTSGRLSPLALTAHLPELASQLDTPES